MQNKEHFIKVLDDNISSLGNSAKAKKIIQSNNSDARDKAIDKLIEQLNNLKGTIDKSNDLTEEKIKMILEGIFKLCEDKLKINASPFRKLGRRVFGSKSLNLVSGVKKELLDALIPEPQQSSQELKTSYIPQAHHSLAPPPTEPPITPTMPKKPNGNSGSTSSKTPGK